jgi:hypothetical protein
MQTSDIFTVCKESSHIFETYNPVVGATGVIVYR